MLNTCNRTNYRSETLNCLIVNRKVPNIFKCLNLVHDIIVGGSSCIVISYIIGMFLSVMQLHGSLLTSYHINHQRPLIEFIVLQTDR